MSAGQALRVAVGWAVSACPEAGLMHHSDRGSPYASEDDRKARAEKHITSSMSRRGNYCDDAAMES